MLEAVFVVVKWIGHHVSRFLALFISFGSNLQRVCISDFFLFS